MKALMYPREVRVYKKKRSQPFLQNAPTLLPLPRKKIRAKVTNYRSP